MCQISLYMKVTFKFLLKKKLYEKNMKCEHLLDIYV